MGNTYLDWNLYKDELKKFSKELGVSAKYLIKAAEQHAYTLVTSDFKNQQLTEEQRHFLYKIAVRYDTNAMPHMKDIPEDIALDAVELHGRRAFQYIDNPTFQTFVKFLKKDNEHTVYPEELNKIDEQNYSPAERSFLRQLALIKDPMCLKYMDNQTEQECFLAVAQNGLSLEFVKEPTTELCDIAVANNKEAEKFAQTAKMNMVPY